MADILDAIGTWPFVANIWFLTAVAAAALLAFFRHSAFARRFLRPREARSAPGMFEQFWSRRDGRALAVSWLILVALTIGGDRVIWSDQWQPVRVFFALLQPVAGFLLVPMTAALYVYKRSVPQVARDESDERERDIQGGVYRRVHAILLGSLVVAAGLLVFNPSLGSMVEFRAAAAEPLDVIIPTFLVLYMLPSVAYAWMLPHPEEEPVDAGMPIGLATGGGAG